MPIACSAPPHALRRIAGALLALALSPAACDDYPKDPAGTLDRVRGGELRVGLLVDPPWVDLSGPAPSGVEVALAEGLAAELGARLNWVSAGEADVLEALEQREVDLVFGGLTWSSAASPKPALGVRGSPSRDPTSSPPSSSPAP